jgi:2-polyprenyl-3-methyl-5-hydroxy-6-metoxy-1,4-benzoquinol methylase
MDWDDVYLNSRLEDIPWHSDKPPGFLVRSIRSVPRGAALDVCCGAGTSSVYLAGQGFRVTGIDVSPEAVRLARERAKARGVRASFRVGDVLGLGAASRYGLVFDRGCFHHMPPSSRERFIRNVHRSLKPGGTYLLMAFSDRNGFAKSLSREDIRSLFSGLFRVGRITESVHVEPGGARVYLYSASMAKLPSSPGRPRAAGGKRKPLAAVSSI